jgi:hypothetical protein
VLVEDPVGIRLEMGFVLGAGGLAAETSFNPPRVITEAAVLRGATTERVKSREVCGGFTPDMTGRPLSGASGKGA